MGMRNGISGIVLWHPVFGVLAAGVFAYGLSLYGAPKEKSGNQGASDAVRKSVDSGVPFPVSRIPMAAPVLAHPSRNILLEEGSLFTGVRDETYAGMAAAVSGEPGGCELGAECDDCQPCTRDTCEAEVCVHTSRYMCEPCDDVYFCNGTNKCDAAGNCLPADQIRMYLCVGGENDGHICPKGDEECVPGGTCVLKTVDTDPCRFFPELLCDEEEEAGVGLTGACVYACFTDSDCDDTLACTGGEICVKDSSRVGYGGQCIGGPTPKEPCAIDADCGAGGQCGGVCQPAPNDPPPCGERTDCQEGPPLACENGRCCSVDSADPSEFVCCRVGRPDCLATGCDGGVAPHTFLPVGNIRGTGQDEGSCTERSTVPPFAIAGESFACPKYSSGISTGEIIDIWGTTGVSTCHDYWEIGDDYCLQNCDPGEWYEVHTIRWVGGHVRGFGSRMRFTFYDQAGRFIEDVITEFNFPGGIELRTVIFSEDPVIPCCGYLTNKPAVQFSPDNRAEWTTTGATNIQAGTNDPVNVVIRRHGICDGGPVGCNVDADCAAAGAGATCILDDPELKWGAPLEVVSAASLGLQSGVLAFEIVGEKTAPPVGACCDVDSGKCLEELPWICEEQGNVFQGIGTSCNVCSDDPFQACDSNSDCRHCDGGSRDNQVCCPGDGVCSGGVCAGGDRDGLDCCPDGGTCEDMPICLPSPPACQITACCDKATGECAQVTANQCLGGPTPGDPCIQDDDCREGGICLRAIGLCEDGGVTPGAKCASDHDCIGLCAGDGATSCQQDSPDCDGVGGPCVGEECVAPCPSGSNPQGFGTDCDPNCCDQPQYSGADLCTEAEIVVINVPPLGDPPVTYAFRGNNKNATFGDWIDPDAGGPGTCNWAVLNPDGVTRDRGWWHAFSLDDCADVRLDLCCTAEISGEVHQPQWAILFADCNPCTTTLHNSVIGTNLASNDRGLPFCPSDDLWQTFRDLPKGVYYHPIYTAPGGHFGEYQFHITVGACTPAACCLPESLCIGGPHSGESCSTNDDCAFAKGDKICVGDSNRPDELCCPEGGECDNDPINPTCVGGSRDGLACCDGGGECKGNCVSDCATLRRPDCNALGGYWLGFGNLPPDDAPIMQCDEWQPGSPGTCQKWGSCCLSPGECRDYSNPACNPVDPDTYANCCQPDGSNCMDKKLCDTLGGTFVAEAMCDYPLNPCPACEIQGDTNCQLCDNGGDFLVYMSDLTVPPLGVVHADDFVPEGPTFDTLCVWGTYLDANNTGQYNHSCSGVVEDNFRVRVYTDNGFGLPGDLVAERWAQNPPKSLVPDCPGWNTVYEGNLPLNVFSLNFAPISVTPGETHWLEVANQTDVPAGSTEPISNTCYWHWMQVLFTSPDPATPEHGNRVSAVGSDDRCAGGYYDSYPCTTDSDCSGGICKAGYGGGYIEGSQRWGGQAFCLGNGDQPANFLPGPVTTGACCDCKEVCEDALSQFECTAAPTGGGTDNRWYPNQTCADIDNCAHDYEPGDDCGSVAVLGTVASVASPDCTPPQPLPGACTPIIEGMRAIDTACTNTDGACCPTAQITNQLGEDVWYCYTTTCTGVMYLSMCNTGNYFEAYDSYMAVHHDFDNPTDCPCPGQTTQFQVWESDEGCNGIADGGAGTFGPQIVFPGECWVIRAGGWGSSVTTTDHGRGMIAVGCKSQPPYIARPPVLEMIDKDPLPLPGHPYDGGINRKNRFISVSLTEARTQAIRVVMGPKADPRKPGNMPPPFDIWAGQEFYAGAPRPYCENAGQGPSVRPDEGQGCGPAPGVYTNGQRWFWAAPLVCDKGEVHWMDWTKLADYCNTPGNPNFDGHPCWSDDDCGTGTCGVSPVVHLYHEAIVPSHLAAGAGPIDHAAVYEVSVIDGTGALNIESNYSWPVQLHQAGWGDVVTNVATCPNWPPEQSVGVITDVVATLNKFSNNPCAIQKTRADLVPCRVDFNISITDVVTALAAFGGGDYEDRCGSGQCVNSQCRGGPDHGTPCTEDIDCSSDVCQGKLEVAGE